MRKILFIALVCVGLAIANADDSLAQDKLHEGARDEMVRRINQAEKKRGIVCVTLKDGTMRWGRPAVASAQSFSLSSPAADGSHMKVLLQYDQVRSVSFESRWTKTVRGIRDVVTAPILGPVFMFWAQWRFRC